MEDFDHEFYTSFYPDLNNMSCDEAQRHFLTWGKNEKRVCNKNMLRDFQNKTMLKIKEEYENLDLIKISLPGDALFNVLIRTSNRPENFMRCIESVLDQKYTNYKVYVCHDKIESLDYLDTFKDNDKIECFQVFTESNEKYRFNLYCNQLMDKVKKGYVIFLDDDDMFCHDQVFNILNYCMDNKSLLIWKFFRPDKIIFPSSIKSINLGEIDTTSFCCNIKNYKNCEWRDKKNGDYCFINQVMEKNMPKTKLLNKILTKTQFSDKIGNLGN
jgi:hypothetical protein